MACPLFPDSNRNELILRVQPNTSMYMKMNVKSPGVETHPSTADLDLTYGKKYEVHIPEAYERLILDIVRGDHR